MTDSETTKAITLPTKAVLEKAFGPVAGEFGADLLKLYRGGRDRILIAAIKKIKDINDGRLANAHVARDVMWNGAIAESEACTEYFAGILASSRSEDGIDDAAIQYAEVVKSLSSKQLHLHYIIYHCLGELWRSAGTSINVGHVGDLSRKSVWFDAVELASKLGLRIETDPTILHKEGLIQGWQLDVHDLDGKTISFFQVGPTTFGVLLYACAHNQLEQWLTFPSREFGHFADVPLPNVYASSCAELRVAGATCVSTHPTTKS